MSDSQRLHMCFLSMLQSELADEDFRHLDTLAWAVTGVLLQKTTRLPDWVCCMPDTTHAATREQGFRRWLNNRRIEVRQFYEPFITKALQRWSDHPLYIALDTTQVTPHLVIARTAVVYRGRAVPVAWQVFNRQSVMLALAQYTELIRYTAQLLPSGVPIVVLGDRGFRDVGLMRLLRQLDWHFRLRLAENESVSVRGQLPMPLTHWKLKPFQPRFLQRVRLTAQRYGPVNLALAWDGMPTHDAWRIVSDQPANLSTLVEYALRMGIDFGFLDDKSAGFELEDTELQAVRRLDHLLLILALCSLYLISSGTQVVKDGQRRLVDAHWQRGLSYLQIGWRWLDYCLAQDAPLPTTFHLDSSPDPEPVSTFSARRFETA